MTLPDSQQINYDVIPIIDKTLCKSDCQYFPQSSCKASHCESLFPCNLKILEKRMTPSGCFVAQAWACPQVVKSFMRKKVGQVVSDNQTLESAIILSKPTLTKRVSLSWNQYFLIEAFMCDILRFSGMSIFHRLIALRIVISFIEKLVAEQSGKFQPMETGRVILNETVELNKWITTIRHNFDTLIVPMATKDITINNSSKRVLVKLFLLLVSLCNETNPESIVITKKQYVAIFLKSIMGFGKVSIESPVPFKKAEKIFFPTEDFDMEKILRSYFLHQLHRKEPLIIGSLQKGIDFLILEAALLKVLSGAFALQSQPETHFADKHALLKSIAFLEISFFIKHSIATILNDNPALDSLFLNYSSEAHFPYLLLR